MMAKGYLAIDTSNYTTSCAIYRAGGVIEQKRLLPVPSGQIGLRQSDAVFSHVKALGELVERLREQDGGPIAAVGVSARPRDADGSYMPCFLSGEAAARTAAAALGVPLHRFSHQAGHVAAALYGADRMELAGGSFVAFHLSGGTTECLWIKSLAGGDIELLSGSGDLNAGQLVDRVGRMLGLDFPAGPALEKLALKSGRKFKVKAAFNGGSPCLSGVENQCAAMLGKNEPPEDIALFCLWSVLAALAGMAEDAIKRTGCGDMIFAGGVMSNTIIRAEMEKRFGGIFPPPDFCRDNAMGTAVLTALREGERPFRQKEG